MNLFVDEVVADLKAHVGLSCLAVGAFPDENSVEHHPSDRLVQLVDACIVVLEAVALEIVGLPEVGTMTEDVEDGSGTEVAAADTVYETWDNVVVALPAP